MEPQYQDKDNKPLYSSEQPFEKEKRSAFHRIGQWCQERLDWVKGDLKHSRTALSGLIEDLRAGKRGFNRHFWKCPYFCIPVVVGLFLVGANFYLEQNQPACAVYYDGQEIGFVDSRQQGTLALNSLEEKLEQQVGQDVFLPDTLGYKTCMVPREEMEKYSFESSIEKLPWMVKGVEMCVEGKPVMVMAAREDLDAMLESYQKSMLPEDSKEKIENVSFDEDVTFRGRQIAVRDLVSGEDALKCLSAGQDTQKTYIVQEGDNLWSIARANDMLVDELCQVNPQLTEEMKPGQEIKLASIEPLLNVIITSTLTEKEVLPCEVQTKLDSDLDRGKTKIVEEGEVGEAQVVYRLVRQNQQLVTKSEVEREVVKAPESRVVAKGTRNIVATVATASRGTGNGSLRWPVGGPITSGYGTRGGTHSGLDIGAGHGAAVGAAAGGTVSSTGWMGGYGNCVLINHGNGMTTRYAHLSQINVSSGQSVSSGQVIGSVGSTGNSTGPHLHFEVIVNGSTRNPLNYLN
ncbi:MAG: M23 family metallopeptidase [Syntrophaceticus sp.]|nr:M23 family metallopeptidase [Syntrophaceticus sp.]MDD4360416.1 M23 family metallopeptidase [Syntrophaceticus sp.]